MSDLVAEVVAPLIVGILVTPAFCCAVFAIEAALSDQDDRLRRRHRAWGAALSATGVAIMAFIAWWTRGDGRHGIGEFLVLLAVAVAGGLALIVGLGPFIPWLLRLLGRHAARLPAPLRPSARHLADDPARTAPGLATTICATAVATATLIVAGALSPQDGSEYQPEGPRGAVIVRDFAPSQAAALRALIQRELPDAPITQNNDPRGLELHHVEVHSAYHEGNWFPVDGPLFIGDETLLRYLTGAPATPYDDQTVVLITDDHAKPFSATIDYGRPEDEASGDVKSVSATTARPADPDLFGAFIPAKLLQDLGFRLEPKQLIVDPALRRTSAEERERLAKRIGESATTYVERGFQPPATPISGNWSYFLAIMIVIACAGSLAATRLAGGTDALLRIGSRAPSKLRLLIACRAALSTTCGTLIGAVTGCLLGLLLAWPATASTDWNPPPRQPFVIPWPLIAALLLALPILVTTIAALTPPKWLLPLTPRQAPRPRPKTRNNPTRVPGE